MAFDYTVKLKFLAFDLEEDNAASATPYHEVVLIRRGWACNTTERRLAEHLVVFFSVLGRCPNEDELHLARLATVRNRIDSESLERKVGGLSGLIADTAEWTSLKGEDQSKVG